MKNLFKSIVVFIVLTYNVFGQTNDPILNGRVSFVTSNNIYVKFENTHAITIGDSLKLKSTNTACLVVKSKSSSSCVCQIIEGCEIQKGDEILFTNTLKPETEIIEVKPKAILEPKVLVEDEEPLYKEKIRGRISARLASDE